MMTDSPAPSPASHARGAPVHAHESEAAWQAYVNAARLAQQSHALADGIAAGQAWRRFLDTFLSPQQRDTLDGVPQK